MAVAARTNSRQVTNHQLNALRILLISVSGARLLPKMNAVSKLVAADGAICRYGKLSALR